ncbi:MAG TPA: M28 family peptidase [Pseudacidobacterium sp.]|jgi:hypothetical protein|nr:M28 family peptidase [Pseudacidobacterium sp.]
MRKCFRLVLVISLLTPFCRVVSAEEPHFCKDCVRADEAFLASDVLQGRGSATRDEHIAAAYIASLFQSFGLEPGGDTGDYIQKAPLPNPLPDRVKKHLLQYQDVPRTETWNVVGILRGSDTKTQQDAILLTAHLDHLGIGPAVNGDSIYNGADDDASGTTAVIELARSLNQGKRPKRPFFLFSLAQKNSAVLAIATSSNTRQCLSIASSPILNLK